jgi:hypothetical protein
MPIEDWIQVVIGLEDQRLMPLVRSLWPSLSDDSLIRVTHILEITILLFLIGLVTEFIGKLQFVWRRSYYIGIFGFLLSLAQAGTNKLDSAFIIILISIGLSVLLRIAETLDVIRKKSESISFDVDAISGFLFDNKAHQGDGADSSV